MFVSLLQIYLRPAPVIHLQIQYSLTIFKFAGGEGFVLTNCEGEGLYSSEIIEGNRREKTNRVGVGVARDNC